jgi:lipopolysaccharide/colanic/teichoic acid biosynthesis glycosyltransferase
VAYKRFCIAVNIGLALCCDRNAYLVYLEQTVAVFYNEFEKYIPGFSQRLIVKPGLTGHAQVNGGYDLKPEEKIILDIEYIKKMSLWFDIKILFKTVLIVFNHKGAK